MKKYIYMSLMMALACVVTLSVSSCSSTDDDEKDMQQPVITDQGITANPIDCQVYQRGETIPFHYVFTDDRELGNFNIEIHNDFEHHTHSGSAVECESDDKKDPVNPWVYNRDFTIPAAQRSYDARIDIPIPADIDPGEYHFMVRLTDKEGWQQLKAVAIRIVE